MILKQLIHLESKKRSFAVLENAEWKLIEHSADNMVDFLEACKDSTFRSGLVTHVYNEAEYEEIMPFMPKSFRDFMLYEKHAIDAARGFVKKYVSYAVPIMNVFEKLTGRTFPPLKPSKRFYKYPIFYMGNHLNFFTEGASIAIPSYTKELDYELEIAALITKPLKNASIEEVNAAIGGFVILNDFSARDQQMDEMKSGFGPMKTKNFANAISITLATADIILPKLNELNVQVFINHKRVASATTVGPKFTMQEAIAYASWEEQLHPGELFGSGTIPSCTGIENGHLLRKGDTVRLQVEGIGVLTNHVI
jgi:2-keto-4-pentenoate hydratase/2-oxohepta-3-ene-1,7-dioic acid hydratase in catechol pathway